jgi:hypothetical protein
VRLNVKRNKNSMADASRRYRTRISDFFVVVSSGFLSTLRGDSKDVVGNIDSQHLLPPLHRPSPSNMDDLHFSKLTLGERCTHGIPQAKNQMHLNLKTQSLRYETSYFSIGPPLASISSWQLSLDALSKPERILHCVDGICRCYVVSLRSALQLRNRTPQNALISPVSPDEEQFEQHTGMSPNIKINYMLVYSGFLC